jgi:diguanylate cyclase (GGDEF)-like protein/PAS domain S-box-containing protein
MRVTRGATGMQRRWRVITWLLLAICVAGSIAFAAGWRSNIQKQSRQTFDAQAGDVAASISVSLARVDDLTATMRALIGTRPNMSGSNWDKWHASLDIKKRYAGVIGLGYVEIVQAAQLVAFEGALRADDLASGKAARSITVIPPGPRPYYCFMRFGSLGREVADLPPGLDLCKLAGARWLSKPRDTGQLQVAPLVLGGRTVAQVVAPVYARGVVPATVTGRRHSIIGLAGELYDFDAILRTAIGAHHGLSVRLSRQDFTPSAASSSTATAQLARKFAKSVSSTVGSVGPAPATGAFRRSVAVDADGGWTIHVSSSAAANGRRATTMGLLALLAGLLLTALLGALFWVLTRGRQRALDMVERRTLELKSSEGRFRSLATASPMGILQTDATGLFVYGNDRLEEILGCTAAQLQGEGWIDVFTADGQAGIRATLELSRDGEPETVDAAIAGQLGHQWVRFSAAVLTDGTPPGGFVASLEDVTAEVATKDRLTAEARNDALTGLPNRTCFLESLSDALQDLPNAGGQVAVLFIDLDRFKQVNDAHGHAAGDELLLATAGRIAASLRPGDTLSRLGGDEFAVLMTRIEDVSTVTAVVDRLQASVSQPFSISGLHATVGASVGLVLVDDPHGDPSVILQNADMAMYRAKAGSTRFEVFDLSLRENVLARLETEQALRGALGNDELALAIQPIFDLTSGRIAGGEALLRWNHPRRGMLLPSEFLPLAESTGLILPIGDWVLRRAVEAAMSWTGASPVTVAVNFSAQQLASPTLIAQFERLLATTGIDPRRLAVEVLETHLVDDHNLGVLRDLKRLGVQVSIDDFGTGYSSLLYLKRLPADSVKIDRALICDIADRRDDQTIVTKVVELAHDLGIKVIAEGIERPAQAEALRAAGCDFAQGFLWSPGVAEDEFSRLIASGVTLDNLPPPIKSYRGKKLAAVSIMCQTQDS